jgi:hypothetical protein
MARFVGVPSVPLTIDPATARILLSLKENVELLTGQRGETDAASTALLAGTITAPTASSTFQTMTARGAGVVINNVAVPTVTDYLKLLQDVSRLANDVATLRTALNTLIVQLRSQQ